MNAYCVACGSPGWLGEWCTHGAIPFRRLAVNLSPLLGEPGAYAGIGSRETPPDVLDLMTRAARWLAQRGWTLRSGAAPGADSAFERGALDGGSSDKIDLFLPWPGFEERHHEEPQVVLLRPDPDAWDIARRFHPAWPRNESVRALLARNTHQVLGDDVREGIANNSKGWTLEALALQAGWTRQQVFKWESGEHLPTLVSVIELANVLHVTIDSLVTS